MKIIYYSAKMTDKKKTDTQFYVHAINTTIKYECVLPKTER